MKIADVVILILFLIWVVVYSIYRDRKWIQFIMLIIMPFGISYLVFDSYQRHQGFSFPILVLISIFLAGFLNNSIRFYNTFLRHH